MSRVTATGTRNTALDADETPSTGRLQSGASGVRRRVPLSGELLPSPPEHLERGDDALDPGVRGVAEVVRAGLQHRPKRLPSWLLYDAEGSGLFELITELPEYYVTRTERTIFEAQRHVIAGHVCPTGRERLQVIELGAGTATKSQILLGAIAAQQGGCTFHPVDVSPSALELACRRIGQEEPLVQVAPWVMHSEDALVAASRLPSPKLVLFIGSSLGNYEEPEALGLLRGVREAVGSGGWLLLGMDRRKTLQRLIPAYDDAQGVTARFNKNILARINRELGGRFELERFEHVVVWNESLSRLELYLESKVDQLVHIEGLGLDVAFRAGERIHTESSHKYDDAMVDHLLGRSGFRRLHTFTDEEQLFLVVLARVT